MPLSMQDVGYEYHPGRPVLQRVSGAFRPGSMTVVVGPNGSGKSTLLRLLLGALRPLAGSITLDGEPVAAMPGRARAARIAYIPQTPSLSEGFSVEQVVRLSRYARPRNDPAVSGAIEAMELAAISDRPFAHLSVGQQQRVTVARALAQLDGGDVPAASQVILADEPCSAMDPAHELQTMRLLSHQADSGRTVVVVLHDLTAALRFAGFALVLTGEGAVAAFGTVRDVLTPAVLDTVFGVRFAPVSSAGLVTALIPELTTSDGPRP
ncbi:MAG: ABC transporter ATP-binding protein [Phycisphaeraceae bacterium]|nr:ABC transporter ATP-binding protein [Phycisphaeraceae bacterium]